MRGYARASSSSSAAAWSVTRTSDVAGDLAPSVVPLMHLVGRVLCVSSLLERHEAKASQLARLALLRKVYIFYGSKLAKVLANDFIVGGERQPADEDLPPFSIVTRHDLLLGPAAGSR